VRTVKVALVASGSTIVMLPLCVAKRYCPALAIVPSKRMFPFTVPTSTLFASTLVIVTSPLVESSASSPVAPVMRMPSFTVVALILPLASSTMTSPWIDFAVTKPEPPLTTISPLTVSA
jgi:hypothetical protein